MDVETKKLLDQAAEMLENAFSAVCRAKMDVDVMIRHAETGSATLVVKNYKEFLEEKEDAVALLFGALSLIKPYCEEMMKKT